MFYLAALLLPLTFFYSPKVDKKGTVFLTRTMTISQERNTPAYTVFKLAQNSTNLSLAEKPNQKNRTLLSSAELNNDLISTDKMVLTSMSFDKKSLLDQADQQLRTLAMNDEDSLLLSQIVDEPGSHQKSYTTASESATIKGQFELVDGVAIIDHKVTLKRILEGQSVEIGKVNLKEGTYEIAVGSFEGEITAEIKDQSGLIIGEDHQKLVGLTRQANYFKGPTLRLGKPLAFAMNVRDYENKSENSRFSNEAAKAYFFSKNFELKKTSDIYPNVARHSATIGFIESPNQLFASTLSIRTTKDKSETILFSAKWVDAVTQYVSEKMQIEFVTDAGFLIGRVLVDGKPIAGARIVVENQPSLEPIYFNTLLIPDFKSSQTTDNGLFIFPGLRTGSYQVTAFLADKNLGSQIYFVEPQIVSYQEIQSTTKAQIQTVRSFDAFTGQATATDLQIPGVTDILTVESGFEKYKTYHDSGLVEILNRPQLAQYASYIYLQNLSKNYLQLPQIEDRFINYLKASLQVNDRPQSSLFIGFVQYSKYEVHLAMENSYSRIIYFNATGEISDKPVPFGGFAIFNIPAGSQEIVIENKDTQRTASQVFYAGDLKTFVSHFEE